MSEIINFEVLEMEIKPKRYRASKYTEEEKRVRHLEATKRVYLKNKEKISNYYKERYINLPQEEKQEYI